MPSVSGVNLHPPDHVLRRSLLAAGGAIVALSVFVLIGRFTGQRAWVRVVPDGAPMAFVTAIGFLLGGSSLIAHGMGRTRFAAWLGALLLVFGGGTLLLYVLAEPLSLAAFKFEPGKFSVGDRFDGRMSPNAAGSFALLGLCLLLMGARRPWPRTLALLASLLLAVAFLALSSYLVGLRVASVWWRFTGMAVHTAAGFFIASGAVVWWGLRRTPAIERSTAHSLPLFASAGGLILVVGAITLVSNQQLLSTSELVVRSHVVRGTIDRLVAEVARMESSARGYALTGVKSFRTRVGDHSAEIEVGVTQMTSLVAGNAEQSQRVARLRELAAQKIVAARELMRVRDDAGQASAQQLLSAQPGAAGRALVDIADEIRAEETRLLELREREWNATERGSRKVQITAGALALLLVAFAFGLEYRASKARRRAEEELREANERLEQRVRERTADLHDAFKQIAQAEQRYRTVAVTLPQLVWTATADGRTDWMGPQWLAYTGRECDVPLGESWATQVHPDDRAAATRAWQTAVASGAALDVEFRIRRHDGEYRWFKTRAVPLRGADGAILRWFGTSTDIHAQKETAAVLEERVRERTAALRESEERFRAAFDHAGVGMALVGLDGRWLRTNRVLCEMLGYSEAELQATTFMALTHPDDLPLNRERAQRLTRGEIPVMQVEKRYRHHDGHYLWARLTTSVVRDAAGRPEHYVSQVEDISERKRFGEALRESEEKMRLFAEHAPAAVAMFDREMRYLVHSRKWLRDYSLGEQDIVGRSHYDVFPDLPERWREIHRRCLAGAVESCAEDVFERGDGSRQWLQWEVRPWRDATGAIGGIVMFTNDITERKRLESDLLKARDAALEASRLKSEFLANMSHEIRTPMNGVIGMTDLLLGSELAADQREMAQVVQKCAESLLTIVNDILDFSKIEAGKMQIEAGDFDLPRLVHDTVALLVPPAALKQVRVGCVIEPGVPVRVRGDSVRVRQVLTNLVGNAVKFTDAGDVTVTVRIAPGKANRIRFDVRDTGPGISAEAQKRLFEAFVQGDGSSTRRHGGTGLGLAISRQLVELMGGTIGLESEPGRGSLFWFELDFGASLAGDVPVPDRAAPPAGPVKTRHFLVAEDNDANQIVVRALLHQLGHTCEIVADGAAALRALAPGRFDAILMDCQMPRMDGYAATRQIRAGIVPGCERMPIIALTAYAMAEDRAKCRAAGMDHYLSKPLRTGDLRTTLAACGFESANVVAPKPPVEDWTAVLDERQVAQLRDIPGRKHPQLIVELAELFVETAPVVLDGLRVAVPAAEAATVEQLAHRLAGSCAHIGAFAMRTAALALERAARQRDWTAAAAEFERVQAEWKRVEQALGQLT